MGFRKMLTGSNTTSTPTSAISTASSSSSDLSSPSSPTDISPVSTVGSGLTQTTTAATVLSTSPSSKLEKTPSRLRKLLSRSSKSEKVLTADEWQAQHGPPRRNKRPVDPVHRAMLESWAMDFGRKGSFASDCMAGGKSPFASPRGSLDLRRVSANDRAEVEEVEES